MVRGGVLVVTTAFSTSGRVQCGTGRGVATSQTGRRRHPLWERQQKNRNILLLLRIIGINVISYSSHSYSYHVSV